MLHTWRSQLPLTLALYDTPLDMHKHAVVLGARDFWHLRAESDQLACGSSLWPVNRQPQ
jgi:hypothetical protein